MGGCCGVPAESYEEAECPPPRRVRRSDEDGDPDVDRKAKIFIDNFHRRQKEASCAEEPPTPCSAAG